MRIIHAAFVIALTFTTPAQSWAGEALSLYQAMEIVTGTDLRERPRGFAACLEDVLVKVSGDPRLRSDPRVTEMKLHAADYVRSFTYTDPIAGIRPHDDQGTYDRSEDLTVTFDPAQIDTLLASLGEKPWHGPRPVLVPVMSVHGRHDVAWLLAAGEPLAAEQRAAFQRIAAEAGLTVSFPAASEFPKWGVVLNAVAKTAPCGPRGMIVVRGSLDWSETAPGWIGSWRTCWKGREHAGGIHGGGYDLAFANIVRGAVLLAAGRGGPETEPP